MTIAGTLTQNSDLRLKKDITNLTFGINTINSLRPVTYKKKASIYSNEYGTEEIGFIAQEMRKVLPQLVAESNDENKILSINYIGLVPILVKALQEENERSESLQAKIEILQNQLDSQKKEFEDFKYKIEQLISK